MSRDYKSRKPSKSTTEKGGSAFLGGFVGYALGLASAIAIWLYLNYAPSPFLPNEKVASSAEKNNTPAAQEEPKAPAKPVQEESVITVEEKPRFDFYKILPGIDEPEFDHEFKQAAEQSAQPQIAAKPPEINSKPAEMAPQPAPSRPSMTAVEPPQQIAAMQPRIIPAEPVQQPVTPQVPQIKSPPPVQEKFFLQAGSFRKNDEAENLKARLALIGVFASIQPIDLAEKGTWYRVRIGPFASKTETDRISASLKENGMDAQFIKTQ